VDGGVPGAAASKERGEQCQRDGQNTHSSHRMLPD
jgi:hypothetical protein